MRQHVWAIACFASLVISPLSLSDVQPQAMAHIPPEVTLSKRSLTLTDTNIRQLVDAVQAAVDQRDTNGVMKFVAPQATIDLTIQSAMGSQQLRLTRAEYERYLQKGFAMIDRYNSKISNLKIQIASNRKSATVTYRLTEEATLKQQPRTLQSLSMATARLEVMQDQILMTAMRSMTKLTVK